MTHDTGQPGRDLLTRWWRPALVIGFVALAVVWRLVRADLGAPPNLELVTAATFAATVLLRSRWAFVVPLAVTVVSDVVLGNTAIALFTWSAWLVVGLGSLLARRTTGWRRVGAGAAFGVAGSLWFFLWTNFGVWFQGRGTWYAPRVDGLVASYVAGLPFLRTMLLGNLVLVPLVAAGTVLVDRLEASHGLAVTAARPA
ncbi:DUF6580 family putative transport protein [Cellulosimicrobium sp. CUA-896]|uniref:DUF6580 family putative transport protein n=1 Tax=Cellulosimicrobium sp. CUA-896 TaxID=1517881 RepID=UPI000969EA42|nr:DUF6580 family putative transport protein [Cellulosimicrobium sp. CUA-896]OLT51340.1 hypothetical protein BJF88_15100 [Cellulosimicrobium sp. CUA-896]